jgi:hypothetical protein
VVPGSTVTECSTLQPGLRHRLADAADEMVVVNQVLADLCPGRAPVVVPDGTDEALLAAPQTAERLKRHAVYVGSISERFDVDLVRPCSPRFPIGRSPCTAAGLPGGRKRPRSGS